MGNQDQETFRRWINSTITAKPLHGGQRDGMGSNRGREKKLLCSCFAISILIGEELEK